MGVNFDVTSFTKAKIFNPKEVGYEDSVDIICEELRKTRQSFIKIGWYLKHIYEEKLYTIEGYSNIYECAQDKFHMSQGTTTRYINLCNEYSIGHDSPELDKKYVDYNISQLFEMLPMKEEQLEKVTPDMTVKQIRDIKNETTNGPDDGEIREHSDVPGQTSLEEDFPEYLPETEHVDSENLQEKEHATSHKKASKKNQEYATSHKEPVESADAPDDSEENMVIDSSCIEIHDQPELPVLKNNDQRKEWLGNYKAWGIWYRDENIDVNYYKFDFPDGSRLIVAEYPQRYCYWNGKRKDESCYHLLEKNKQGYMNNYDEVYRNATDSETYLVEFLKKIQKR